MIPELLEKIGKQFPLTELDCGEYATQKISGMRFQIRRFRAEGLGSVSAMTAVGFLGLMKMDTLVITPTEADMPLLSYDRVLAMGNDTLIYELYDTLLGECDLSGLDPVLEEARDLPDHDPGSHWYDSIKLSRSFAKKGKKQHRAAFDRTAAAYLDGFLQAAKTAPPCDGGEKRKKSAVYVEGLLSHGGPATDVFVKGIGKEKTAELFRRILFATEE